MLLHQPPPTQSHGKWREREKVWLFGPSDPDSYCWIFLNDFLHLTVIALQYVSSIWGAWGLISISRPSRPALYKELKDPVCRDRVLVAFTIWDTDGDGFLSWEVQMIIYGYKYKVFKDNSRSSRRSAITLPWARIKLWEYSNTVTRFTEEEFIILLSFW